MSKASFIRGLGPVYPRIYNDVSIALLSRQIGATVVTVNISDFEKIHPVVDFRFRKVTESQESVLKDWLGRMLNN